MLPFLAIDAECAAVAYHEASHCCAAHRLQIPFRFVEIIRTDNGGYRGVMRSIAHRTTPRHAVLDLAGACGEARWSGEPILELFRTTAKTDLRMARDACDALGPRHRVDIYSALVQAQKLVEANWSSIERLAIALIERDRLEYDEVLRVLQPPIPVGWRSPRWPRQQASFR